MGSEMCIRDRINNDVESASSKNRKAKELGVPIISEEEFIELAGVEIE